MKETEWKKLSFNEQINKHFFRIGALNLWIERKQNLWRIAHNYSKPEEAANPADEKPEANDFQNFVANSENEIIVSPVLPDLAVVCTLPDTYKLLPKRSFDFYLSLPVWLQLYAGIKDNDNLLLEIPIEKQAKIWFGESTKGELAYSFGSDFFMSSDEFTYDMDQAICPLKIKNASGNTLEIKQLSLQVKHLNLYLLDSNLFSSKINIEFKGVEQSSELSFGYKPPEFASKATLINSARVPAAKSVVKKTFNFIKSLYPLDL